MTHSNIEKTNLQMEQTVRSVLRSEPRLGPSFGLEELRFESGGVLLLRGEVPDVATKKVALEKVGAIPGVTAIADHLHVAPAVRMGDKEIRVHVCNGLVEEAGLKSLEIRELDGKEEKLVRGAPLGPHGRILVEVKKGLVILNGHVRGLTSKRLAGVIAWWVPGVRDVINGLEVDPPEDDGPDRIADAIRVVLEKDPFVDAGQIKVGVRDTLVRLTGIVPNETERQAAERDAWMVFGVDTVVNEIAVQP
jgi:osmotically-inducible protein OsmY